MNIGLKFTEKIIWLLNIKKYGKNEAQFPFDELETSILGMNQLNCL